ncbi:hypothetical protein DSM07_03580 [Oenococcus sp. UCMA 16435]|nr:hypothetical protein DSM07_03580 [Oenococcus sp. UCMA 16435]MDN6967857.1 hypothetical protein [Oenococcus sp. UCMA 17063]
MGSGVWTASAVNLSKWTGLSIGIFLFINGFLNALTNQFLIHHFDWKRFLNEMIFICFFSYFIDFFVIFFNNLGIGHLPIILRTIVSCLGITLFCIGISLYQRANIVMHPNDDTTNILRFLYLKGSATGSQLIDFVPPILVMIVSFIFTHHIYSVNIATLYSVLFNGLIIRMSDELVWPHLEHNFREKIKQPSMEQKI